jgi:hypothetical protein
MTRLDPTTILRALADHEVRYVLIGGLAATLHGSPLATGDVDICPEDTPGNLGRLAGALGALDAAIHAGDGEAVPLPPDPDLLAAARLWNLSTPHGRLDVSFEPSGTGGYADLRRDAVTFVIDGVTVPTASLPDVIRSKEAAGRERDRLALPTLRRLLEEIDRRPPEDPR